MRAQNLNHWTTRELPQDGLNSFPFLTEVGKLFPASGQSVRISGSVLPTARPTPVRMMGMAGPQDDLIYHTPGPGLSSMTLF